MTTKKRMDRLVPYPVIDAAVQGDADAVSRIVDHYSGYIAAYALRTSRDQYGFPRVRVAEDLRRRLETKLILGIIKFNLA